MYGIKIQYIFGTPLIYASGNGDKEIVQSLLSQPGIEINRKDIKYKDNYYYFDLFVSLYITFR